MPARSFRKTPEMTERPVAGRALRIPAALGEPVTAVPALRGLGEDRQLPERG